MAFISVIASLNASITTPLLIDGINSVLIVVADFVFVAYFIMFITMTEFFSVKSAISF